jgi:hypothetical protein
MSEPVQVETMPSIGGIVTLFMGAMIATSGSTWAMQHSQPIPWIVWLAPVAAVALTSLLLGLAKVARQRMGVPYGPGALNRQRRVLLAAFLIGGLAGVWAGMQAPAPTATATVQSDAAN